MHPTFKQTQQQALSPFSYELLHTDLQEKYYTSVPFPVPDSQIQLAVDAFLTFLQEPSPLKEHINFSIAPEHRRGDVGFQKRASANDLYNDDKEFFHFHPAVFDRYGAFLEKQPRINDFLEKAIPLWEGAYQVVEDILKTLDPHFPGIHEKVFNTACPHLLIRFLRYDWHSCGKYLAKPHFDAGSVTLGIAESCPGLRIGSNPENLRLVEHSPGHAVFMFSGNMEKVITQSPFYPGWHDVIQMDETFVGRPFSRWAVVAFIDAHGVDTLSRDQLHQWSSPSKIHTLIQKP